MIYTKSRDFTASRGEPPEIVGHSRDREYDLRIALHTQLRAYGVSLNGPEHEGATPFTWGKGRHGLFLNHNKIRLIGKA